MAREIGSREEAPVLQNYADELEMKAAQVEAAQRSGELNDPSVD